MTGLGAVPPKMIRPALIVICTNGGRHRRRELLRLAVIRDARGAPVLVQSMSPQPGRDARRWTPVEGSVRAADGHQVISKRCPLCAHHLKRRLDDLTAEVAQIAVGGAPRVVDISGP